MPQTTDKPQPKREYIKEAAENSWQKHNLEVDHDLGASEGAN